MNKEQTDFLLKYAKIGVLSLKGSVDEIEYEVLKQEFIRVKTELTNPLSQSIESVPGVMGKIKDTTTGEKKESAVGKWFGGIAGRQKKYQEEHPDGIN